MKSRICRNPSNKCLCCHKLGNRRKLQGIPCTLRDIMYFKYQLIIDWCRKICWTCLNKHAKKQKRRIVGLKNHLQFYYTITKHKTSFQIYTPKKHTLSKKWVDRYQKAHNKLNKHNKKMMVTIKTQQKQLKESQHMQVCGKYRRIRGVKVDYDAELANIPTYSTGKWINRLRYHLYSELDRQYLTGFSKTKIIQQARLCKLHPEQIFHMRLRIKHYMPYSKHSLDFGISETSLKDMFDESLSRMDSLYAQPRLVNGQGIEYWTRARIKENTPRFANRLRQIEEEDDKVLMCCDGTYQFTETIQTHHDIRKKQSSGHKKQRTLVKVHIFCCANGIPVQIFCTWANGLHSDGNIFECILSPVFVKEQTANVKVVNKAADAEILLLYIDKQIQIKNIKYLQRKLLCPKRAKRWLLKAGYEKVNSKEWFWKNTTDNIEKRNKAIQELEVLISAADGIESTFIDESTCKELFNLQKLIQVHDDIICDNGYKVKDPRLCAPKQPPADGLDRGTPLTSAWKRGITAVRQVQERLHKWIKRNKFCYSEIHVEDICRVPAIWRICAVDMIELDVKLMKDDTYSEQLTDQLIDMRQVAINPADIYWRKPARSLKRVQQIDMEPQNCDYAQLSEEESNDEEEEDDEDDEDEDEDDYNGDDEEEENGEEENGEEENGNQENDQDEEKHTTIAQAAKANIRNKTGYVEMIEDNEYDDDWVVLGKGWSQISEAFRNSELAALLSGFTESDFLDYIGNDFRLKLTRQYLKRIYLNTPNLKLLKHKVEQYTFLLQNMRSKWRIAKYYNVVLVFNQIFYWLQSLKKYNEEKQHKHSKTRLPHDETHWYEWLIHGKEEPVSKFLHQKYFDQHEILVKRAQIRLKNAKKNWYKGINLKKAKKAELKDLAEELELDIALRKASKKELLAAIKKYRNVEEPSNPPQQQKRQQQPSKSTTKVSKMQALTQQQKEEIKQKAEECGLYSKILQQSPFTFTKATIPKMKQYCRTNHILYHSADRKHQILKRILDHATNQANGADGNDGDDEDNGYEADGDDADGDDADGDDADGDDADGDVEVMDLSNLPNEPTIFRAVKPTAYGTGLEYMKEYPVKEKLWFDINFQLFHSKLARLQHRCECFAGAQLPGPCAHTCTAIMLVYYAIFGGIEDFLKLSSRERKIKRNINDLTNWSIFKKKLEWYCVVCKHYKQGEDFINCEGCGGWYHPECLGLTMDEIKADEALCEIWHCPHCLGLSVWVARTSTPR